MDDMLSILRKRHAEYNEELSDVLKELGPLEKQKNDLEERMEAIQKLILLEEGATQHKENEHENEIKDKPIGEPLSGKSGQEAYEILVTTAFRDKNFREPDIRKIATEKGLRINNKPITSSYSRAVIGRMIEQRTLKRVKKGLFTASHNKVGLGLFDSSQGQDDDHQ